MALRMTPEEYFSRYTEPPQLPPQITQPTPVKNPAERRLVRYYVVPRYKSDLEQKLDYILMVLAVLVLFVLLLLLQEGRR